ncbi:MAG: enoyl-CoA hydratase/isomerase family protein [Rhodobacteraceae bacterium]|nr:enoyl-CoA hydratase/isomerase family protein [Paracoccaceae bacterium]
MNDLIVKEQGHVGRITLNRPKALNALTHDMCKVIEKYLNLWLADENIMVIVFDAVGGKAFCAGGDITEMYIRGKAGDLDYGHAFWRDEYRLNAKIFNYPKPIASFLNGFTMGGGVGIGCHGKYRIVGESSRIAMPECTIGLVPDVGGSYILANSSGHLGEFHGLTGTRMGPAEAILVGFADHFISEQHWEQIKDKLSSSGDIQVINNFITDPEPSTDLLDKKELIDQVFGQSTIGEIESALLALGTEWSKDVLKKIYRNSPLSLACALQLIKDQRHSRSIEEALDLEFRFTFRSARYSDFIEGIRAQVIDKDFKPEWKHSSLREVAGSEVEFMLGPLGNQSLKWKEVK